MLTVALVVACAELAALGFAETLRRRSPFAGGTWVLYRGSAMIALLSLACILAALLLDVPESRGVAAVIALAALGWLVLRRMRKGPRVGPLQAETDAPPPAAYTVRTQPRTQPAPAYVPAYSEAAGRTRSARSQAVMRQGVSV